MAHRRRMRRVTFRCPIPLYRAAEDARQAEAYPSLSDYLRALIREDVDPADVELHQFRLQREAMTGEEQDARRDQLVESAPSDDP